MISNLKQVGNGSRHAIFFDRDGTIIFDKHYLKFPSDVELLPGAKKAMKMLKLKNFKFFLFTNQSGISRNLITMDEVVSCNDVMIKKLGCGFDIFQEICIASEAPTDTPIHRKPSPRFILEMISKYHLDPDHCFMVGDKETDVLAGVNANIHSVLITSDSELVKHVSFLSKNIQHFSSILEFAKSLNFY